MPHLDKERAQSLVVMQHTEWKEFQKHWRWLYDSLEGGDRYRYADYFRGPFDPYMDPLYAFGWDAQTGEGYPFAYNQVVERNLIPHLSDMSESGRDLYIQRLHRTPVPQLVEYVITRYLSRIFSKQIERTAPKGVEDFWSDTEADGGSTQIGQFIRQKFGPLLLALGQIDLVFGRPETSVPEDQIKTKADMKAAGVGGVKVGYILPENMTWWQKDNLDEYVQCLVHERDQVGNDYWRHWTDTDSNAYTGQGDWIPEKSFTHNFGFCPVKRFFDDRNLRTKNVGRSRMDLVAQIQRNIYNRKSELVLHDIFMSHALLQGPEEYCQANSKVTIGPGNVLPKKKDDANGTSTYEGWEFLTQPVLGAEATRQHIEDDMDEVMRHFALLKPAGATTNTVSQSGVSKSFDMREGNDLLSEVAETLGECEEEIAATVYRVLTGQIPKDGEISVRYPQEYDLFSDDDLSSAITSIQKIAQSIGLLPLTEATILKKLITTLLPGIEPETLQTLHDEVDNAAQEGSKRFDNKGSDAGPEGASPANAAPYQNSSVNPTVSIQAGGASVAVQALNAAIPSLA